VKKLSDTLKETAKEFKKGRVPRHPSESDDFYLLKIFIMHYFEGPWRIGELCRQDIPLLGKLTGPDRYGVWIQFHSNIAYTRKALRLSDQVIFIAKNEREIQVLKKEFEERISYYYCDLDRLKQFLNGEDPDGGEQMLLEKR
jgi:uncharacterized protein YaeQ